GLVKKQAEEQLTIPLLKEVYLEFNNEKFGEELKKVKEGELIGRVYTLKKRDDEQKEDKAIKEVKALIGETDICISDGSMEYDIKRHLMSFKEQAQENIREERKNWTAEHNGEPLGSYYTGMKDWSEYYAESYFRSKGIERENCDQEVARLREKILADIKEIKSRWGHIPLNEFLEEIERRAKIKIISRRDLLQLADQVKVMETTNINQKIDGVNSAILDIQKQKNYEVIIEPEFEAGRVYSVGYKRVKLKAGRNLINKHEGANEYLKVVVDSRKKIVLHHFYIDDEGKECNRQSLEPKKLRVEGMWRIEGFIISEDGEAIW
ncbi:30921_t:CDS:2, partial [Gigaspora margarita]